MRSAPAAGPVISISVSAVMRRAYFESGTTCHLPFTLRTSMTEPPCAIISMSTSAFVMSLKRTSLVCWGGMPGNISSSLVYSWFTTRRPCADGSAAPGRGM